ncbi:MAG: Gfo/Idh/MocA family oxidoreductase [Ginsengibacter sp.]
MTPINTAVCSFGMSGLVFHAPFLSTNSRFNFYAVWERTKNIAAEKYPDVITYRTLEEMLSDDKIELVVVNTPNYTHFEYAKKALEAGKHVIVEKPFTVTVEEGEQLIKIAKENDRLLSVYQNRRYDSDFKTMKKVIDQQLLGDLVEMEMDFKRFKETPGPKLHKTLPGPGAGIFYDLGSHLIDQALQFFGMPDEVFADIRILRPESKVDDCFEILLYYPSLRVRLKASHVAREGLPGYIIHGQKGSFVKPNTDVQEKELIKGVLPDRPDWGTEPDSEMGLLHTEIDGEIVKKYIRSEPGNYNEYFNGIFESIRNNAPLPVTAQEGLQVISVIIAAFESQKTGCKVSLK